MWILGAYGNEKPQTKPKSIQQPTECSGFIWQDFGSRGPEG